MQSTPWAKLGSRADSLDLAMACLGFDYSLLFSAAKLESS